ncbi:hypothetical protein TL16_g08133 [Triparma laevis f. inornata]|uniref:GAF domain-containing protein n=2 Tax=Triparma laevis TaxID=1534972 RepID=A0A9W7F139_9STRA|nr:hypothetical protein TL16_g08133 [Triparma laevis f. inornata]GMH99213.1 hypothetical protein TrLO_g16021 [Triparma laevis f. longispina]
MAFRALHRLSGSSIRSMQQSAANPRAINNKAHAFRCLTTESSSSSATPTELQLETLEALQSNPTLIPTKLLNQLDTLAQTHPSIIGNAAEPSKTQLHAFALSQAVPFVGFGVMDNAIMILSGDYIDMTLGVIFGISTLCAAAIGNILSDLAGVGLGTIIEDFAARLGLPDAKLSSSQMKLRSVRFAGQAGCAVGITVGCIIGMFPLLLIDSKKIEKRKKEAALDGIFLDVVNEAKELVGAEATSLFVVENDHIYAKYVGGMRSDHIKEIRIPVGKGIAGRVALTGEPAIIYDVRSEPDFNSKFDNEGFITKSMVCTPVIDSEGNVIAVVQAINKVAEGGQQLGRRKGFNQKDLQVLQALGSHISVALQGLDAEDEGVRFKDTIKMLKETGGVVMGGSNERSRRPLHKM